MDFDPDTYDKTSFDAIQPAKELIKLIKANYREKIGTVVDIGCGPGNTTKMLAQELNAERIVGIDIDPEMIEFAKINNKIENIEYYSQDISSDCKEWSDNLRKLLGKVSVIFSNYTLHWIQNWESLQRTTKNLSKLLTNSGVIVIDVLYLGDIYRHVSPEERVKYEEWLKYPSEPEVMGQWLFTLKSVGLTRIDIKYSEPKSIYPDKYYCNEFIKIPIKWFKYYLKTNITDIDIDDLIKQLIIKDRVRKLAEKSPKGEDLIEIKQQLWTLVISK